MLTHLFYFEFESNFQVLGRVIYQRISCEFGGLTLILEGLIFGILHYLLAAIQYQDTVLKSPLIIKVQRKSFLQLALRAS